MTRFVGNILLWLATVPAVAFVVVYQWRARWWTSRAGQQLMALRLSIALILANASAATLWPGYPGRAWVRLVVFATVVPALWWGLWELCRAQFWPRKQRRR